MVGEEQAAISAEQRISLVVQAGVSSALHKLCHPNGVHRAQARSPVQYLLGVVHEKEIYFFESFLASGWSKGRTLRDSTKMLNPRKHLVFGVFCIYPCRPSKGRFYPSKGPEYTNQKDEPPHVSELWGFRRISSARPHPCTLNLDNDRRTSPTPTRLANTTQAGGGYRGHS